MTSNENKNQEALKTLPEIEKVIGFLEHDKIRYHQLAHDAVELFMQAKNLTIQLIIYSHNSHLIFRVPGYIRNVQLNRLEVLTYLMQIMSEVLDIRYEVSPDGRSLSACCQHILEDAEITRAQFDLAMMIILHVVDDTYPKLMQLLYAGDKAVTTVFAGDDYETGGAAETETPDLIEDEDEPEEEAEEDEIKIN
jgi:hypothetical protein